MEFVTAKTKRKYQALKETLSRLIKQNKDSKLIKNRKEIKDLFYKRSAPLTPELTENQKRKVFVKKDVNWLFKQDVPDYFNKKQYKHIKRLIHRRTVYRFLFNPLDKVSPINWYKIYRKRFYISKRKKNKKFFAFSPITSKEQLLIICAPEFKEDMKSNLILFNKYRYINFISKKKNFFINYSNFEGKVIKSLSCGGKFNGSLKRSYYAVESLLLNSNFDLKPQKNRFILNIISSYKDFKIKKNLKNFLIDNDELKIIKLHIQRIRAHNGVRMRKKPRK